MVFVFVYGTLKVGFPNHFLLQDQNNGKATFLFRGTTIERFPLIVATEFEIPMMLNKPGTGEVNKLVSDFCDKTVWISFVIYRTVLFEAKDRL